MKKFIIHIVCMWATAGVHAQLVLEGNARLVIDQWATLTVEGPVDLNNDIDGNGILEIKGTTVGLSGNSKVIPTLISSANTLNVISQVIITKQLGFGPINNATISPGFFGTGNFILRSNAQGTASVGDLTNNGVNSGNNITAPVTVERYLPARNRVAWRLLSAPVTSQSAGTLRTAWQLDGAAANSGMHITQAGGAATNGFDAAPATARNSILYYDGSGWQTPSSTTGPKVSDHNGAWLVLVRGHRNINLFGNNQSSNTTLSVKGTLRQGNVVTGVAGAQFSLISNPYASAVDYEKIFANNPTPVFYVWDTNLGEEGAFRTVERTAANTYQVTPTTGTPGSDNSLQYIQSGQSFFIQGNSRISFTENMKTNAAPSVNVYRTANGTEEISVDLLAGNSGNVVVDGVRTRYNNTYNNLVDENDVLKLPNLNENLAVVRNATNLSVEKRTVIADADTIFLKMWYMGQKNYRLLVRGAGFAANIHLTAFLVDKFLQTTIPVSLYDATQYNFAVTADAASADANRFMIVFGPAIALPNRQLTLQAAAGGNVVTLKWQAATPADNIASFEVEKSGRSQGFVAQARVAGTAANLYQFTDAFPQNGANYYRIKMVEKSGTITYSNVALVRWGKSAPALLVYPNPVIDKVLKFRCANLAGGHYTAQLFNNSGQRVATFGFSAVTGTTDFVFVINHNIVPGTYRLTVSGSNIHLVQNVVVH